MKLDAGDLADLRPLITQAVTETLAQLEAARAKLGGRLSFTELEAAALLGVERHALRDARFRGEVRASRIGKRVVYSHESLLALLEGNQL